MAAVAASSTALGQVKNSLPALTAINASVPAKTAVFNSPLKTSVTKTGTSWEQPRVLVASGTGMFVRMQVVSTHSSTGARIDGVAPSGALVATVNDVFVVTKFATSLGVDWYYDASVITYIVC